MMRAVQRLHRYILGQLAGPFVFFFLSLTGVIWLTQSLRSVDLIINKGLSAGFFFYLTFLLLPTVLTAILPIALFAAVLYAFYRLSADSELAVMFSAGLSPRAVAWPVLIVAGLTTIVCYTLTLYFMPTGYGAFKELRTSLRHSPAHVLLQEGAFNTIGQRLTVYIRAREPGGEMHGILVHDNRDRARPVTMMAQRGALVNTPEGPRFIMVNGNRQQIDQGTNQLSMLNFDRYTLDLSQFLDLPGERWREPSERYLHELLFPTFDTQDDVDNVNRMLSEAHERLTDPLYTIAFTLIALSAILAGQFSRRGYGMRIAMAVGATLLFRLVGLGLVNATAKVPALAPLIYVNVAIAIGGSIYLILRRHKPAVLDTVAEPA